MMAFRPDALALSPPPPGSTTDRSATLAPDDADWLSFKRRFVAADGRIVDTGNGGISHSEGQGYGLLFAVTFNDRHTFETILRWTQHHLARAGDSLHAWRFDPRQPNAVDDLNNATDGDIFIAAALSRAARRWHDPAYAAAAVAMGQDILGELVTTSGGRTLLLPGAYGFAKNDAIVVNPSYYVFPLFADLAWAAPSPQWAILRAEGLRLIGQARFGQFGLPADWVEVSRDGSLSPAPGWPPRFSGGAIRVVLNLAWSGQLSTAMRDGVAHFWAHTPVPAAWIDLRTGQSAGYQAGPGMQAVVALAAEENPPSVAAAPDYYSSALIVLSRIAALERPGGREQAKPWPWT